MSPPKLLERSLERMREEERATRRVELKRQYTYLVDAIREAEAAGDEAVLKQLRILQGFVRRDAAMLDAEVKMAADHQHVVIGKRSRAAHKAAAEADRKLNESEKQRIKTIYADRVRVGDKYGAIKALAAQFEVSRTTISAVIRKPEK